LCPFTAGSDARPIVTLTSDFGIGSPYVAAMKAVVLSRCPEALLVDVSHEVPAFDVPAGAFLLWAGTRDFGAGCIHLAVVDPGVGTARGRVAVRAGGSFFVAPDNGLLDLVLEDHALEAAVVLERPESVSRTFEGRDVFAPAAGSLAAGRPLEALGAPTAQLVRLPPERPRVLWVDRFGNLVTNLKPPVSGLRIGSREVRLSAATFAEAPSGEPFFYTGSLGYVEVGVREARADEALQADVGAFVEAL
jgi:S-adenosyl-L-methionine hydrolase (adenosine-forming)